MSTGSTDYIASYWTLAGNVVPLGPPDQEASPHDLSERLAIAAQCGYRGMGFMHSDMQRIRQRYDDATLRAMFADHGIDLLELEFLVGWIDDGEALATAEAVFQDMLDAAAALGIRHFKLGPDMEARAWPHDRMSERFAALCRRAGEVNAQVVLEPMPWSNVADLDTAIDIVQAAGEPNGGLLVDIWHMARGGIHYDEVAKVPTGLIKHVELNDARAQVRGTLLEDTLNRRLFCGEGDFDVVAFVRALIQQGYDGPYGIEILSAAQRQRAIADVGRDAIDTARQTVLAALEDH